MAKDKIKRLRERNTPEAEAETMQAPIEAVPHLFNAQVLAWHRTQYEALKAVHDVLVEIRDLLKEG